MRAVIAATAPLFFVLACTNASPPSDVDPVDANADAPGARPPEHAGRQLGLVASPANLSRVWASEGRACALTADNEVRCWGKRALVPVALPELGTGNLSVYANADYTCAIQSVDGSTEAGALKCVPFDDPNYSRLPPERDFSGLGNNVKAVALGTTSCAILGGEPGQDTLKCWGTNGNAQIEPPVYVGGDFQTNIVVNEPKEIDQLGAGVLAVAAGLRHVCAVINTQTEPPYDRGVVKCWGHNSGGELGDGTFGGTIALDPGYPANEQPVPTQVLGLTDAVDVIAGANFTCALTATGQVWCWGANGVSNSINTYTNVPQLELEGVTALSHGAGRDTGACAIKDGAAVRWNPYSNAAPAALPGLESGVTSVASSSKVTCARGTFSGLKCFADTSGSLLDIADGIQGNGSTTASPTAVNVTGF